MLNIELQSCGFVMLLVVLLIFVREKSLDLYSRRLFFYALISCMMCLFLDGLSIVGIVSEHNGIFPEYGEMIICKLYLISLVVQSYEAFLYAAGEFFAVDAHKGLRNIYLVWLVMGCVLIAILPIGYYVNGRVIYTYGVSTLVTYVVVIVYIISTIAMAFRGADHSSLRRRWAILIWQGLWLVAAAIQFFNPGLLLVGFAAAFGMVIIYAELENPHEGIDRTTGQYTANALMDYIGDRYQHNRPFASVQIRIEYLLNNAELETRKVIMIRASNYLNQLKDAYVFRRADDVFILIYKNEKIMKRDYQTIVGGIDEAIDMPVRVHYIVTPDSLVVSGADEYFRFHYFNGFENEAKDEVILDSDAVKGMREYNRVKEMIVTALADNRVEVFYQPFYNVSEKRFTAAEALVRIRDTDGSIVAPGVFIPIAEENGLIIPLGIEIFRQVCSFLKTGRAQQLGIECIEVNMSVAQFDKDNPAAFVQRLMDEYDIEPSWINLEITETASVSTKKIILKNMYTLISKGIHFSLDDFGTGRSNMDYFVEMPVDIIKFDYIFTHSYFKSEKARYVMESLIELMHKMGLAIVVEGVETEEELKAMCSMGVEYIQGFYFSRPVPEEEFIRFLEGADAGNS